MHVNILYNFDIQSAVYMHEYVCAYVRMYKQLCLTTLMACYYRRHAYIHGSDTSQLLLYACMQA